MDKIDSMQEQIGNVNREVEILRKKQREVIEIRSRKVREQQAGLITPRNYTWAYYFQTIENQR